MFTHQQIIRWTCDICGRTVEQGGVIAEGASPLLPQIPEGWVRFGTKDICGKHKLSLRVDRAERGIVIYPQTI